QGSITHLERSSPRKMEAVPETETLPKEASGNTMHSIIPARQGHRDPKGLRSLIDHSSGGGIRLPRHSKGPGFQDTCFFPGDLRKVLTQDLLVFQTHGRDQTDLGILDGISGIQTSAKANFQHHPIYFLFAEPKKGQGGQGLEMRWRMSQPGLDLGTSIQDFTGKTDQVLVGNPPTVDPESLLQIA